MRRILPAVLLLITLAAPVTAEEGMWLLSQLEDLDLKSKGLEIDIAEIYNPEKPALVQAVARLGGTAELVSAGGLLLTNHHVAYGAVQRASTGGTDYMTNGFLAVTRDEEIQAPGYSATILKEMKDVTGEILAGTGEIADLVARDKAIETRIRAMVDAIEEGHEDISAKVTSMYNGKQYILFVNQRFDDIRVVYVPPMSIGNYGGDIDNWMWPRHTGDFSFLRIYMAPDGTGRKYHEDNVPYRPPVWLKVATEPLQEGDFTFILGYPGSTRRYRTSYSVEYSQNHIYPSLISQFQECIDLLQEVGKESEEVATRAAGLDKGLNNGMKNFQGNLDGMLRTGFVDKKRRFEQQLMEFIEADPERKAQYGDVLDGIKAVHDEMRASREHDDVMGDFGFLAGTLASIANELYYTVQEREKPEGERDSMFSERDVERAVSRLHFRYMTYHDSIDRALLRRTLDRVKALPEGSRIAGLSYIFEDYESIDAFIDQALAKTKLKDVEHVRELYGKTVAELDASDDPFLVLARHLYPEQEQLRKIGEERTARLDELRRRYIDALWAWQGSKLYPDANSTIRLTYGEVAGYEPRDAVIYRPFTTLSGVLEKHTCEEPFNVSDELFALHKAGDYGQWADPVLKDVPVAFTHRCDITGGNSGSPLLNARGELVGIAFDGNYETLPGNWQYDTELQRSISVDIRYVLFITEKLAGADHILREMGLRE
jgi:hypothetical protein